jgi:DNA-binding MarR family transcriptional regulator
VDKEQERSRSSAEPSPKDALDVFNAMVMISRLQDKKLQTALSNLSVHPAQYSCLFVVCRKKGLNLRELAQLLRVENSTASVTVRRMEKAGLIQRRPDESDCRMTRLYPTEYGKEQFESAKRIMEEFIQFCFGELDSRELRILGGLLDRVCARLNQYEIQPAYP